MPIITISEERQRLETLLDRANVPEHQRALLEPVIDNLCFQRVKLEQTRAEMETASVVVEYDNGGGQHGIRENPLFKGYLNLWRGYMIGIEKLSSFLPKELQEEVSGDVVNILDQVKKMKAAGI